MDIDFWVMPDPENADALLRALEQFGAPLQDLSKNDLQEEGVVFQIGVVPLLPPKVATADQIAPRISRRPVRQTRCATFPRTVILCSLAPAERCIRCQRISHKPWWGCYLRQGTVPALSLLFCILP
jgi:hypothetical protein